MPKYIKVINKIGSKIFPKAYEKIGKPDDSELYKEKFFKIANKIQSKYGLSKKKAFKKTKEYLKKYETAKTEKISYKREIPDTVIEFIKEISP